MKITPLVQKAITKINEIHQGESRKAEQFPYVVHPYAVAILLSRYTDDENTIVAGLLHDVLEDVDPAVYSQADICRDFSQLICQIVQEVSVLETAHRRSNFKLTWRERKLKYLDQLTVASPEALMICAADKIHFIQSITTSYLEEGESLWYKLNPSVTPQERFWFCQKVLAILRSRLNNPIVDKLARTLEAATASIRIGAGAAQ
ncbi:MAG: HD domain-containing protein [Patescibacteria group bacterium]|jgi:(p)ppGpp synthase/HD superfamily hydrolase